MEMNPIFLSVIVPVYNEERYIRKCILSILRQSYKLYELIVINDGSTDDSRKIVEDLAMTDDRIRFFTYPNEGVSIARNKGMEKSKGKFILFIDADDWIEEDYLEKIIGEVKRNPVDLYIWGITKHGNDGSCQQIFPYMNGTYDRSDFLKSFMAEQYGKNKGLYGYVPNKLLKSSIIKNCNLRFNPKLRLQEDYDFYLSYYAYCDKVVCFPYAGYHYVRQSSVKKKKTDYLSLIDVQLKCYHLLSASKETLLQENEKLLRNTIGGLVQASFLEMSPVKIECVSHLISEIREREYAFDAFVNLRTKYKFLKNCIIKQYTFCIYVYLLFWRMYLTVRQK